MGAEASFPLQPGEVVAERFEIERPLGKGGMGAVFAACDIETGAQVAIKVLLPELCEHGDVVARFEREARATTRLKSEHVARVLDSGVLPTSGVPSGLPFMVMEYLEGRDLKSLVRALGPLPIKDAVGYVCQACEAIAEAHALGIVHRDLKPANLFLTRRPDGAAVVKVLDFGIAKFLSPNIAGDHLDVTRTRAVLGSRAYMSPEQMLRPKDVDARADVWALGAILYFLLAGRTPFAAETTEGLILNVVQGEPPPLVDVRPDMPAALEAIVRRCLAKARENRFPNVVELTRALAPFVPGGALTGDRATVELGPPRPPEASVPSMSRVSITNATPGERETEVARTRVWAPTWAPTRAMARAQIPPRVPAAVIVAGAVLGLVTALAAAKRLAPAAASSAHEASARAVACVEPPAPAPPRATAPAPEAPHPQASSRREQAASGPQAASAQVGESAPLAATAQAAAAPRAPAAETAAPRPLPKAPTLKPKAPRTSEDSPW